MPNVLYNLGLTPDQVSQGVLGSQSSAVPIMSPLPQLQSTPNPNLPPLQQPQQGGGFGEILSNPVVQDALRGLGAGILQSNRQGGNFGNSLLSGLVGAGEAVGAGIESRETRTLQREKAARDAAQSEVDLATKQAQLESARQDVTAFPAQQRLREAKAVQAEQEAGLFAEQANQLKASDVGLPEVARGLSKEGKEAFQKLRGKNIADKVSSFESQVSKIPGLLDTVENLRTAATDATYTTTGKIRDVALKELGLGATKGALARSDFISTVDNQILPLLRDTFGAAFTEKEGQSLKATLGDPDSTPQQKMVVLDNFINQKVKNAESLGREIGLPVPESFKAIGQPQQPQTQALRYNPETGLFDAN